MILHVSDMKLGHVDKAIQCIVTISMVNHFSPLNSTVTRGRYMVSKLLKGRSLGLQVSCKSFPTVYSRLHSYIDLGKMTYNYYL